MIQDDDTTTLFPEEWIFEFQDKVLSQDLSGNSNGGTTKSLVQESQHVHVSEESTQANQTESGDETAVSSTQPTEEEVEKAKQTDEPEKAKRKNSKSQWGPTVTLRRSSRNIDDGRPVLEKAQEFKRKWNLENNAGNKSKSQNIISKSLLISVAKDLDVVGMDGKSTSSRQNYFLG